MFFNLTYLKAKTNVRKVLIRGMQFADDSAVTTHTPRNFSHWWLTAHMPAAASREGRQGRQSLGPPSEMGLRVECLFFTTG